LAGAVAVPVPDAPGVARDCTAPGSATGTIGRPAVPPGGAPRSVTVGGGLTNAWIGLAGGVGRKKRSRGAGGGGRTANSRGRTGKKKTGGGGGGAKPGPTNITTGWSRNTISAGGGSGTPKSMKANDAGGSSTAASIVNRRRASHACGPFG
jgi:hypothetical protein